jgi:uncharacterized protein DUF5684
MHTLALALAALQPEDYPGDGGGVVAALFGGVFFVIWLAVLAVVIVSWWKIFEKAGQPGWAAIVPIYNLIVLLQIVRKPLWWIVLFLLPCANIVAIVLLGLEVAKAFGKSTGFAAGLILLPFVFYPLLAFGDARYQYEPAPRM